jgi:hypothetical protein
MSDLMLLEPVELTDAELDMVTGGLALAGGGLVNLALNTGNISVLNNSLDNIKIPVLNNVTIKDIANYNNVSVGAIIQALGGGAAILQRQAV